EGRAVLVHDSQENSAWRDITERAVRYGASAIITNYLLYQYPPWRTRTGLPEAVQQLRLPPRRDNPWAFTVPQPVFARLRSALRHGAAPTVVRLEISARTFAGSSRSVLATIPAADPSVESLVLISHVSAATMPGANCASGVAMLLELARVISHGVTSGTLPALRRNIHFLFANEGYGSLELAVAEPEPINGAVAAVAVCSVGHDQAQTKSSLIIGRAPDALPTFLNDLVESLTVPARGELPWAYRPGPGNIPYVRWKILPYTPWSDNTTWSSLGIPALLAMSLPDRYFHTQLLTAAKTDPVVFERVAAVLGTAALMTAGAGAAAAATIMRRVAALSQQRMSAHAADAFDDPADEPRLGRAADALIYLTERDAACLRSALHLVPDRDRPAARSMANRLER